MIKTLTSRTLLKTIKYAAVCLAVVISTQSIADSYSPNQFQHTAEIRKRVDSYFTQIEKKDFSGAILIGHKGNVILSKGYGYADKKRKVPYTSKTISDIGSITKQFTAAAILKLEMQGKLSTSDTLSMYFKELPEDKTNITLHQLLNMSSGFHVFSGDDYQPVKENTFVDIIKKQELHFKPGTSFEYSNTNYSILALIIERVSGMSYESYLYKYLFEPAGMEKTGYSRPKFVEDNIAVQHQYGTATEKATEKTWDGNRPSLHLLGGGGILSTAEDMFKWHTALMSEKILSNEAKKKYFQPYLEAFVRDNTLNSYAYGWYTRKTPRNTTLVYHQGSNSESFNDFFRFIDEDITFIIISNNYDGFSYKLSREIEPLIFDLNYKPTDKHGYRSLEELKNKGMTSEEIVSFLKKEIAKSTQSDYNMSVRSLNRFGYSYVRKQKFNDANNIFEFNLTLHPGVADIYDYYGESLLLSGKVTEGVNAYRKALEINPNFSNSHTANKVIKHYENFMEKIRETFN